MPDNTVDPNFCRYVLYNNRRDIEPGYSYILFVQYKDKSPDKKIGIIDDIIEPDLCYEVLNEDCNENPKGKRVCG